MFRTYDHSVAQFMYPENWQLADDSGGDALVDVSVQSPGSCLWTLQIIPRGPSRDEVAGEVLKSLRESYPDLEAIPEQFELAGHEGVGYDVNFFCLDFLVQGSIQVYEFGDHVGAVVCQAEEREFVENRRVFEAITTSWLQNAVHARVSPDESPRSLL